MNGRARKNALGYLLLLTSASPWGIGAQVTPGEFNKKFKDFDGTVHVRFKIDEPKNFHYSVLVANTSDIMQVNGLYFIPSMRLPGMRW